MKLRMLSMILAFLLVFTTIPGVMATETEAPTEAATEAVTEATEPAREEFECGEGLTWAYENGVLTIKGYGSMDNFNDGAPWGKYKNEIETVIMEDVVYIGARAFYNYDELKTVDFGDQLKEIGYEAFRSCEGLEKIELPASFKVFGESSFLGCKNLAEIHCSGYFPSFRLNSMWECYATIYYPAERPWPLEHIEQLETAFQNRLEFLASDGTDHYVPTEETEASVETEAPTEPATEVPTETPTEAPTEAPTEPETTVPVTEAPTEALTEPETTVATEPPTEVTEQAPTEEITPEQQKLSGRVVLFGMGIALALTMIAALLLVIRKATKKGKYTK